jgi:hypothetical protein
MQYRLNAATLAIQTKDGHIESVVVPDGAVLTIPTSLIDSGGFIECEWDGRSVMILALDLRQRAERVDLVS